MRSLILHGGTPVLDYRTTGAAPRRIQESSNVIATSLGRPWTVAGNKKQPPGVANAKVMVTQVETNARSQTVSGSEGIYTVPFLARGVYKIATAPVDRKSGSGVNRNRSFGARARAVSGTARSL